MITIGLIVFLIGYWFLALSNGQKECSSDSAIVAKSSTNTAGGIAGVVIGLVFMILGIVFGNSTVQYEASLASE